MTHDRPRLAAVDVGGRRVGIAITDPLQLFAQPVGTFAPGEALRRVEALHAEYGLEAVAVGWPLDETGGEGEAVARIKPFAGRLRKLLPGVRIEVQDETGSSQRAVEALVASGTRKSKRRKGHIDAAAACVILEDFLRERD